MAKVTGIGGFFFHAENPEKLAHWYKEHLGVALAPKALDETPWRQTAGDTVFEPFAKDNPMIPAGKNWMINFRVDDLTKLATQLRDAGVDVADIDDYPHGKFTTLADPEGNPIQLWEPPAA